jgi:hypothetical protein
MRFSIIPLAQRYALAESLLPCCVCGEPGGHAVYPTAEGGSVAVCGTCEVMLEAQRAEDFGQDALDRVHVAPPVVRAA